MQIQATTSNSFGIKNSFLRQSEIALDQSKNILKTSKSPLAIAKSALAKDKSSYFFSLHLEALSRLRYINSQKTLTELENMGKSYTLEDSWKAMKLFMKVALNRIDSAITMGDAYAAYPKRFHDCKFPNKYPERYYNK